MNISTIFIGYYLITYHKDSLVYVASNVVKGVILVKQLLVENKIEKKFLGLF